MELEVQASLQLIPLLHFRVCKTWELRPCKMWLRDCGMSLQHSKTKRSRSRQKLQKTEAIYSEMLANCTFTVFSVFRFSEKKK